MQYQAVFPSIVVLAIQISLWEPIQILNSERLVPDVDPLLVGLVQDSSIGAVPYLTGRVQGDPVFGDPILALGVVVDNFFAVVEPSLAHSQWWIYPLNAVLPSIVWFGTAGKLRMKHRERLVWLGVVSAICFAVKIVPVVQGPSVCEFEIVAPRAIVAKGSPLEVCPVQAASFKGHLFDRLPHFAAYLLDLLTTVLVCRVDYTRIHQVCGLDAYSSLCGHIFERFVKMLKTRKLMIL